MIRQLAERYPPFAFSKNPDTIGAPVLSFYCRG
jgi:hypothetical protein